MQKDKSRESGNDNPGDISIIDNDKSYRSSYFNILQQRGILLDTATHNEDEMDLLKDLFTDDPQ